MTFGQLVIKSRLGRILAVWMALLVFSPVTAPLSTCEISDLFGVGSAHPIPIAPAHAPMTHQDDSISLLVLPIAPVARQLKFTIWVLERTESSGACETILVVAPALTPAPFSETIRPIVLRV